MSRAFFTASAALPLLLLAAGPAAADAIFQYSWSVSPGTIATVSASDPTQAGTGAITLTSPAGPFTGVIGTDTVAAIVTATSTASSANPDVIPLQLSGNYTLTLNLTDQASQASGSLSFTGLLSGALTAQSSSTLNTILGTTDGNGFNPWQSGGVLQLGDTVYSVDYNGYLPLGSPQEGTAGGIGFTISTSPIDAGNPGPVEVPEAAGLPEPGTALLAVLGAGVTGLAGWRRRARCPAAV
jgi:hypothetical protein